MLINESLQTSNRFEHENNIDELKRYKSYLEHSQRLSRTGVWDLNLLQNTLYWSDEVYHIFGLDKESFELSYETFLNSIVHEDDREALHNEYHLSVKEKRDYFIEYRVVTVSGETLYVEEFAKHDYDADGNHIGSIGVVFDITQKRTTEKIVEYQYRVLDSVINSTNNLVYFKDYLHQDGIYIGCNEAYEKFVGKSKEEIIGKNDKELFGEKIAKEFRQKDKALLEEKYTVVDTHWVAYPNGEQVLFKTSKSLIFEPDGRVLGILGVSTDITQEKLREIELVEQANTIAQLNKNLEKRIKEEVRKNKEKDTKLFQQSRLAQMGEMISMIAHQWRQPLGAIASSALNLQMKLELQIYDLENESDREVCSKYFYERLENIATYVQNLTTTIDDFRNFYKSNKEKEKTTLKDVSLKALNIIKASLLNDSIEIVEKYDCKENIELYDSEMMQVVLNILQNAQDSFKERGIENPKIVIECGDAIMKISDNGGGIDKAILENIFDPYFSTKSHKNGTGLGLYMSKIIVEEHHYGKLEVHNENNGVSFIIDVS